MTRGKRSCGHMRTGCPPPPPMGTPCPTSSSCRDRHSLTCTGYGGIAAWRVAPRVKRALRKKGQFFFALRESSVKSTRRGRFCGEIKSTNKTTRSRRARKSALSTWSSGALRASQHCLTEVTMVYSKRLPPCVRGLKLTKRKGGGGVVGWWPSWRSYVRKAHVTFFPKSRL